MPFPSYVRRSVLVTVCHLASLLQTTAFIVPAGSPSFVPAVLSGRGRVCVSSHGARLACGSAAGNRRRVGVAVPRMVAEGWEAMVDRVVDDLNKGVAKYIFVRSVDAETAAELRASVLVAGRGYKRRSAPDEGAPAPSLEEVVTAVHGIVKDAIVEREELIAEDEWDKIARGFGLASAIVNAEGDERPASAPPLTLDQVVFQLERMFPNSSHEEREEAARRGLTLEAATDLIMTSAVTLTRMSAKPYMAPRGSARIKAEAPPPDGEGFFLTSRVNGGASAFGIYFDISAKEYPVRITEIRAASSAGLNLGDGKPIALQLSMCPTGSGQGRETDTSKWKLIGQDESLRLPIAAWFDETESYAKLPLDAPFELEAGQTVGLCIHSSDVNGIAIRMARNQAAIDCDMTDDDFGGKESDDELGGSLRNSYYPGQITDDDPCVELRCGFTACSTKIERNPVSQPVPAAFVGAISYIRTA